MSSADTITRRMMAGFFIVLIMSCLAAAAYPLIRPATVPGFASPPPHHARVAADPAPAVVQADMTRLKQEHQKITLDAYAAQQIAAQHAAKVAAQQKAQQQAAAPPPAPAFVGQVSTAGMSAFEACVIQRESGGWPHVINYSSGASGLFGMLMSTWNSLGLGYYGGISSTTGHWYGGAWTAPVSVQEQGFNILYARDGTAPWAPYDGC